jgi:hypothetical protein
LPRHVPPANQQGAQDADCVEQQKQLAADVNRTVRGRDRVCGSGADVGNKAVDVAGQSRRDRSRLAGQRFCALRFDKEGPARRKNTTRPVAQVYETIGDDAQHVRIVTFNGTECGSEPVGCRLEALAQRRQKICIGEIGSLGQKPAHQVAFDAELRNRGIVEQLLRREPQLLGYRRNIVEISISGYQEERCIV